MAEQRSSSDLRPILAASYALYAGAFLAFVLILALLEQLGMPNQYIGYAFVLLTAASYALIGILSRTRDPSEYYVAGRAVPAVYNGMAAGAGSIGAASFMGMAGTLFVLGYDGLTFLLGVTGGFVLIAILIAPYLRKSGSYTVPDFVAARYAGTLPRLLAVVVLIACSFAFLVAQIYGVGLIASRFLGIDFAIAVYAGAGVILLCSMPGGMRGVTWTQVAQYIVLIVAYLTPVVILSWENYGLPFPQLTYGQALADIAKLEQGFLAQKLADVRTFKAHAQPFTTYDQLNFFGLILCIMAGTASLPHVLTRYLTTPSAREARVSVAWSLFFIFLLCFTAPAYAAFAKLELYSTLIGRPLAELPPWIYIYGSMLDPLKPELGLVNICGKAALDLATVLVNCGASHPGSLRLQDFSIDPDIVVISMPEIAGMPYVIAGLVAAGALAAALATANGLLLAIANALSHDVYYKTFDPAASARQHLIIARALLLAVAGIAAYAASTKPSDIVSVVAWTFSLAAAGLFPALVLGIWWKRANKWGAIAGMVLGFGITLYYLAGTRYFAPQFYEDWQALSNAAPMAAAKFKILKQAWLAAPEGPAKAAAWLAFDGHARTVANWWGVKNIAAGLFGIPVGFIAIILVSLVTPRPSPEVRAMIDEVRRPGRAPLVSGETRDL